MPALLFLALALVVSVIGTLILWARSRQPDTPDASIEEFRSKMAALGEDNTNRDRGIGRRGV